MVKKCLLFVLSSWQKNRLYCELFISLLFKIIKFYPLQKAGYMNERSCEDENVAVYSEV